MKLLEILFYVLSGEILRLDCHGARLCSKTRHALQTQGTIALREKHLVFLTLIEYHNLNIVDTKNDYDANGI